LDVFKDRYEEIMNGTYHGELLKDSEASGLISACKKLGRDFVYVSNETLKLEVQARHIIHELMDLFWTAAREYTPDAKLTDFAPKIYKLTSANYRVVFEDGLKSAAQVSIPQLYFRLQLVTDQIAGMTDTYACTLHKSLTNG
jgi:dGTPase